MRRRAAPTTRRKRSSFRANSKPTSRRSKRRAPRRAIRRRWRHPRCPMRPSPITASARRTRWRSRRRAGTLRALAGCIALHIARADDVTQRKLYAAASPLFFVPQLTFMPAVGLYFVARQQKPGQEVVPRLRAAGVAAEGAVRSAHRDARARAQAREPRDAGARASCATHFANGSPTPSWTITPHTAKSGTWYELDPGDPTVVAGAARLRARRDRDRRRVEHAGLTTASSCRSSTTRRRWASISCRRRHERGPAPPPSAASAVTSGERPACARALDHLAHPRMLSGDRLDPRFEARDRLAGAKQEVPDVHLAHEREALLKILCQSSRTNRTSAGRP